MATYKRKCKHCDKWITLRQMPRGQWVAFEGYNTVHDCRKKPKQNTHNIKHNNKNESSHSSYENIDFTHFKLGKEKQVEPQNQKVDSSFIRDRVKTGNSEEAGIPSHQSNLLSRIKTFFTFLKKS